MYTLSNSIEGPKKKNVSILIAKLASKYNLDCLILNSTDVEHDFLDKLLGIKREFIQFTVECTSKERLENFWNELQTLLKTK